MTVAEVVDKFPDAIEVFASYGLHCVGCHVSGIESIEDGAHGHGMDDDLITEMITEANKVIHLAKSDEGQSGAHHHGHDSDHKGIALTPTASEKVLAIMKKEGKNNHVLRIRVVPGGCSGMSYQFVVEEKPTAKDLVTVQHGLTVAIDEKTLQVMDGAQVDYVETLKESGFKVSNPQAKKSCGCGSSFS